MTLREAIGRAVPFAEHLGLEVELLEPGRAVLALEPRPELRNSHGTVHGGVVMTLADVALAVAAIAQEGARGGAVTVELKVSFIGPAAGRLRAEGRCLRAGGGLAFSEGEVRDAGGSLVAKALGTFKFRREP